MIAGTTDQECTVTRTPRPNQESVDFILEGVNQFISLEVGSSSAA